jgi:hypothetical protein
MYQHKNAYQKHMYLKEIGLGAQILLTILVSKSKCKEIRIIYFGGGGGERYLYDYLMSKRVFTLMKN